MGQKVNPIGLRLGINRTWDSRWFANKEYVSRLHQDLHLRQYLMTHDRLKGAGISRVVVERAADQIRLTLHSSRPGLIIGKQGKDIETLRRQLADRTKRDVALNIVEIRKPEIEAKLVAENVAQQLEKRVSFRRAMKRTVQNSMRMGALGIRLNCAGRLGGAEIARTEWYREGRVPLHTLRADIDFATAEAHTAYGVIGIKCWVFKGEILEHDPYAQDKRARQAGARG